MKYVNKITDAIRRIISVTIKIILFPAVHMPPAVAILIYGSLMVDALFYAMAHGY